LFRSKEAKALFGDRTFLEAVAEERKAQNTAGRWV